MRHAIGCKSRASHESRTLCSKLGLIVGLFKAHIPARAGMLSNLAINRLSCSLWFSGVWLPVGLEAFELGPWASCWQRRILQPSAAQSRFKLGLVPVQKVPGLGALLPSLGLSIAACSLGPVLRGSWTDQPVLWGCNSPPPPLAAGTSRCMSSYGRVIFRVAMSLLMVQAPRI